MAPTKNSQVWEDYFQASRYISKQRELQLHIFKWRCVFKTADNGYPQSKTKGTKSQWIGKQAYDIDSLKDEEVEKIYASKCPQVIINTFWPNSTFTFQP